MKKTYSMVLAYAKIFDLATITDEAGNTLEGKPGDIDRGDPKSTQKWLRELAKAPVATVDAYFTSEVDLEDFKSLPGFDDVVTNPQTGEKSTRIKDGNEEYGIGKYIRLKRKLIDSVEFVDKQGNLKVVDKGGAPSVKILDTSGEDDVFVEYDYLTLGAPSNGTESRVRFEVYGKNATTRLEAFGITNLVEFVGNNEDSTEDPF